MNLSAKPTFVIKTLGCKINQYESQTMRECLIKNEFIEKETNQIADFYIINSCTVTHKADRDTRNLIHHYHRINPNAKIIIAGCSAELDSDRNALKLIPAVACLVRNSEKSKIANILAPSLSRIEDFHPALAPRGGVHITDFKNRSRAYIKVQDGCNQRCSYCKVPLVRGRSKSRDIADILIEIKGLLEKGFKEVVLAGVSLGAWGRDLNGQPNLATLIKEISGLGSLFRIRLSSIEPIYVTDDIINTVKSDNKVCKHLHLPLQSGDDGILRAMRRPYTTKKLKSIIRRIRKDVRDVAITTDVLVGFPGEDDKKFYNTLKFIEEMKPSRIHVFSYSKREGTASANYMDNLDTKKIKANAGILSDLSRKLSIDFAKGFIGKIQNIVVETYRDPVTRFLAGYTDRYIRVFIDGSDSLKNKLVPIRITTVDEVGNRVFGRLDNTQII